MSRVTLADIQIQIDCLNRECGYPIKPWSPVNGKLKANIKNYHLYQAYGAFALHQMQNEGGGVTDILPLASKRELFDLIKAYRLGRASKKEVKL